MSKEMWPVEADSQEFHLLIFTHKMIMIILKFHFQEKASTNLSNTPPMNDDGSPWLQKRFLKIFILFFFSCMSVFMSKTF